MPGRGAYLCKERACLDKALREHRLEQHLKTRFTPADMEFLETRLTELIQDEAAATAPLREIIGRDAAGRPVRIVKRATEKKDGTS